MFETRRLHAYGSTGFNLYSPTPEALTNLRFVSACFKRFRSSANRTGSPDVASTHSDTTKGFQCLLGFQRLFGFSMFVWASMLR
jgi:hypothetical protein